MQSVFYTQQCKTEPTTLAYHCPFSTVVTEHMYAVMHHKLSCMFTCIDKLLYLFKGINICMQVHQVTADKYILITYGNILNSKH